MSPLKAARLMPQENDDQVEQVLNQPEEIVGDALSNQSSISEMSLPDSNSSCKRKPINQENVKKISKMMQTIYSVRLLKQDNLAIEISDGVFLGSYGAAQHKENLIKTGITHILCVASSLEELFPESFTYKTIQVLDQSEANLKEHFGTCISFINKALRLGRGKVLVHCYAGKSRSASIVLAWLMQCRGVTLDQALALAQSKRPVIQPNLGFMCQLREFEDELASKNAKRKHGGCIIGLS
mmetsp:Transcript_35927/g.49864  ORF Transcript_35927/g.49864 Transcript_35927/m.49864 type:complete len:240 (-) Transcript_35927:234-953(-)